MTDLLEPKELALTRANGTMATFMLSKFPAVAGREIVATYPVANMPKVGDYEVSERIMLKCMSYVGVVLPGGGVLRLETRELVNNHAGDWETLARLEWAMMEYNCSFFGAGKTSDFLSAIKAKLQPLISPMLTDLLARLSEAGKQPSTS